MDDSGPLTLSELGTTSAALSSTGGAPKLEDEITHEIRTTSSARKNRQRKKTIRKQSETTNTGLEPTDSLKIDKSYIDSLRARLDPPLPPLLPPITQNEPIRQEINNESENLQEQQHEKRKEKSTKRKKRRNTTTSQLTETQPVPDPAVAATIELPPSNESPHSVDLVQGEMTTPSPITFQRPSNDPLLLVDSEDIRETRRSSLITSQHRQSSNDQLLTEQHNRRNTLYQQQPDTRVFVRTHLIKHSTSHDHHGNRHHSNSKLPHYREDTHSDGEIEREEEEREVMVERVLTNGEFVLIVHQYIRLFIMAAHGITAGISLWDTVVSYILSSHHSHSILLLYYHTFPLGLHALYLLATSAVIITLLDRFDIANITFPCLKSCCQPKDLALGVALVLLIVGLLSISTGAFLDSRIALFTKEPTLWSDIVSSTNSTTTVNALFTSNGRRYTSSTATSQYITGWLALSIIRTIALCVSWCIINVTVYNHTDRIEEHVIELDKQWHNHHHHHTHSTTNHLQHHVQRTSV